MAHLSNSSITWDADKFLSDYKITPEDTGFLFFDKIKSKSCLLLSDSSTSDITEDEINTYEYSIREPQLVPMIIELLRAYYPQQALKSLAQVDKNDSSQFGTVLEKCFGILMARIDYRYQLYHTPLTH